MGKLSDIQIADYFHRCFTAVDGLWFMKVEEKLGFDAALDLDNEVWKVFPKIQAREIKAMLKAGNGVEDLKLCFTTGFDFKGFIYDLEQGAAGSGFDIVIKDCPWHNMMVKSGRKHLSAKIGQTICQTEYSTWAREFGKDIEFSFDPRPRICQGGEKCVLRFHRTV